jgi:hypothetical protein
MSWKETMLTTTFQFFNSAAPLCIHECKQAGQCQGKENPSCGLLHVARGKTVGESASSPESIDVLVILFERLCVVLDRNCQDAEGYQNRMQTWASVSSFILETVSRVSV